eukprot:TRINITY_DN10188_c0_g1_i1.p1 TRINITY_DN10188_c0_g1~~TRINITY_DN10188_c0_g1_i1.p1  ORF type:complete len:1512 (+),score=224.61 TRINITY_DN10188_c0_g1_i1:54-4589(+)
MAPKGLTANGVRAPPPDRDQGRPLSRINQILGPYSPSQSPPPNRPTSSATPQRSLKEFSPSNVSASQSPGGQVPVRHGHPSALLQATLLASTGRGGRGTSVVQQVSNTSGSGSGSGRGRGRGALALLQQLSNTSGSSGRGGQAPVQSNQILTSAAGGRGNLRQARSPEREVRNAEGDKVKRNAEDGIKKLLQAPGHAKGNQKTLSSLLVGNKSQRSLNATNVSTNGSVKSTTSGRGRELVRGKGPGAAGKGVGRSVVPGKGAPLVTTLPASRIKKVVAPAVPAPAEMSNVGITPAPRFAPGSKGALRTKGTVPPVVAPPKGITNPQALALGIKALSPRTKETPVPIPPGIKNLHAGRGIVSAVGSKGAAKGQNPRKGLPQGRGRGVKVNWAPMPVGRGLLEATAAPPVVERGNVRDFADFSGWGVVSNALVTPVVVPEEPPGSPITLGDSHKKNALSLLSASMLHLRRQTQIDDDILGDLDHHERNSDRRSSVAQMLSSVKHNSKLPVDARRGSSSGDATMAELMRSLSKGRLKEHDVPVPTRRFTTHDLAVNMNELPDGTRRDAVALGKQNDKSLALASTSVTSLLKPSQEKQPFIVKQEPTPVLTASEIGGTGKLNEFRFGDSASDQGEKEPPNMPSTPDTPLWLTGEAFSPSRRSHTVCDVKTPQVSLPKRSVSMLDARSPRGVARTPSPDKSPTLAAISRHATSYLRQLQESRNVLTIDEEATCCVIMCAVVAVCRVPYRNEFGSVVNSENGSDDDIRPARGTKGLHVSVSWAERAARPHIEDLEVEAVESLFKDFVHGKESMVQKKQEDTQESGGVEKEASNVEAEADLEPKVEEPARADDTAQRFSSGQVTMVDASTGMLQVKDVAVDATIPMSERDSNKEGGTSTSQAATPVKAKKKKKKVKSRNKHADPLVLDALAAPPPEPERALVGSIKSLEKKVNKVLEQSLQTTPTTPVKVHDRAINLEVRPVRVPQTPASPESDAGSVKGLAVSSKTLWIEFLEKGDHPQDLQPPDFIDYCCTLGYTQFEALCISALWFNRQPEDKGEGTSVICNAPPALDAHTYPVGNGASYTDVLPSSALFKAVSKEVMETCHSVSFMKGDQFKVVRVVEAHCNEEVTSVFMAAKGKNKTKVLYYNPVKMKPFLNALIEGITADYVFSSEAIIRKKPIKGQSLCLLLCEAAIGATKAVTLRDPSNRLELQKVLRTSEADTVSSTYSVRCMDGSIKVGRHYASRIGALPRFMVQVEIKETSIPMKQSPVRSVRASTSEKQYPEMKRELVVECPEVEELSGVYEKVGMLRDMAVFGCNNCRLFTDSRLGWMLSDTRDGPDKDEGIVTTVNAHNGKLPHNMKKWQCSDGTEWVRTEVTITERIVDRFENIRNMPPPLPTTDTTASSKGLHSYTTPVTGYGVWEWVFRISYCIGQVGFGISVGEWLYTDVAAPTDVTIRLELKQQEAILSIYKIGKVRSSETKVISLWSPTQLVFPQVNFPTEGTVSMLTAPRYVAPIVL